MRPATCVSQHPDEIRAFIESLEGPAVLKPLQGTRGGDVFFVSSARDPNLQQIIDVILRRSAVMAQARVPGAEEGDMRVVVLDGEILAIDGKEAAVRQVPAPGEIRSNIHAGGHPQPGRVDATVRRVVAAIGPKLVDDGLFLAGLDFIGGNIIEVNVFSTGGLRDAERYGGVNFSGAVIEAIARRAGG